MTANLGSIPLDDVSLLERIRDATRTDRDALFAEIVRAHHLRVAALCLHLCGDERLAEEAQQAAFLTVARELPGFRGEARLTTWIYRIAVTAALRARAWHRGGPVDDRGGTDAGNQPYATTIAGERARRVQMAMAALPAEQRVAVALFAIDGLTHVEIGDILGVPERVVWSRLHQGRKAIARVLG